MVDLKPITVRRKFGVGGNFIFSKEIPFLNIMLGDWVHTGYKWVSKVFMWNKTKLYVNSQNVILNSRANCGFK